LGKVTNAMIAEINTNPQVPGSLIRVLNIMIQFQNLFIEINGSSKVSKSGII